MKINFDTKILIISDITEGAYGYQYAFDCVPKLISKNYHACIINSEKTDFENYQRCLKDFQPDLIFGFLQKPTQIIKVSDFLNKSHPVPAINWFLEDPNAVINPSNNVSILDATENFDLWFSQDAKMQKFWKTKSFFMPPGFDEDSYSDLGLEKVYDISYIGQLGPRYLTEIYWPYIKEISRYGKRAMLCIDRPMGLPLMPRPIEKFLRSKKRRNFLQSLPFWKCGWKNPADEKEKCRIINQSKIHFGMVRLRGQWEDSFRKLLPGYPIDKHGLFYQMKGRLFQAVGAGAMAINEYCSELENLFVIDKEIVTFEYGDISSFRDKLAWYIKHDDQREKIAKAGYLRGKKDHTFSARINQIFDYVRKEL